MTPTPDHTPDHTAGPDDAHDSWVPDTLVDLTGPSPSGDTFPTPAEPAGLRPAALGSPSRAANRRGNYQGRTHAIAADLVTYTQIRRRSIRAGAALLLNPPAHTNTQDHTQDHTQAHTQADEPQCGSSAALGHTWDTLEDWELLAALTDALLHYAPRPRLRALHHTRTGLTPVQVDALDWLAHSYLTETWSLDTPAGRARFTDEHVAALRAANHALHAIAGRHTPDALAAALRTLAPHLILGDHAALRADAAEATRHPHRDPYDPIDLLPE